MERWPDSSTRHFIECTKCGRRTATYLASHGGSAADDEWNRRATTPTDQAELGVTAKELLQTAHNIGDQFGAEGHKSTSAYRGYVALSQATTLLAEKDVEIESWRAATMEAREGCNQRSEVIRKWIAKGEALEARAEAAEGRVAALEQELAKCRD